MANSFDSTLMPRLLGSALEVLTEEFWLASKINKNFDNTAGKIGDTLVVAKPVANTTYSITPAATPPALQSRSYDQVSLTVDTFKGSRFDFTDREMTQYMLNNQVPNNLAEAARALAKDLNSDLFATYKSVYGYAGTAGTNPFNTNVNPVVDVREQLNRQFCPDNGRFLAVDYAAETAALKLDDFKKYLYAGNTDAFRDGYIGKSYGFDVNRDKQVPIHTAGTITTGLIAKAATVQAAGLTTIVGHTAASTGACALVVGDIINIAHADTTVDRNYVVTAAATQAAADTDVNISIQPPLRAALAGSEVITVKASHTVNLAFHPEAFGCVMKIPGSSIEGAPTIGPSMTMVHPKSGIPMKLTYLPGYHAAQWELSILYGVKCIDPRKAARLAG